MLKKIIMASAIAASLASCTSGKAGWESQFNGMLPLLGHRNWVVVTDMAYPLQSSDGITTIYADEPYLEVLSKVKSAIDAAPHVYAHVWRDRELEYIGEDMVEGIDALKASTQEVLGPEAQSMIHEDIIRKLDAAGQFYRILLIKTPLTVPYTTVFFELDCGYWDADHAAALAAKMAE